MKRNFYTFLNVSVCLIAAHIPQQTTAQCTCADGSPATRIEHTVVLPPTMSSSTIISFPKFDPAIGDLVCIDLFDTISIVTLSRARNMDTTSAHEPKFRLTVSPAMSGPGLSMSDLSDVVYGPDSIQIYGTPGDSLVYGPDTVYNNFAQHKSISNFAAYSGLGNVNISYTINGGIISIADGINYDYSVRNNTWGSFRLVYSWCPTSFLARNNRVRNAPKKDAGGMVIFPNPVKGTVFLQFDKGVNGRFVIDILNTNGQLLQQNLVKVNHGTLQLELTRPVVPGVYYLLARDLETRQQYPHKLLVHPR